jgi:hypothetical protein
VRGHDLVQVATLFCLRSVLKRIKKIGIRKFDAFVVLIDPQSDGVT